MNSAFFLSYPYIFLKKGTKWNNCFSSKVTNFAQSHKKISSLWNNFQKLCLSLPCHLEKEVATLRRAIKL